MVGRSTIPPVIADLADVAHQYAFGSEENRVNAPDFAPGFRNASQKGGNMAHLMKKFPWLHSIMNVMPEHVMAKIDPDMAALVRVHMVSLNCCNNDSRTEDLLRMLRIK